MGGGGSKNAGDAPPSRGSAPPSRAHSARSVKSSGPKTANPKTPKKSQSEKIIGGAPKSAKPGGSKKFDTGPSHFPTRINVNINEAKDLKDPQGKRSDKDKATIYCVLSVGATVRIVESLPDQKLSALKFPNNSQVTLPFSRTITPNDDLIATVFIHVYAFTPGAPDTYLGECQVTLSEQQLLSGQAPVSWQDLTVQDGSKGHGRLLVSAQPVLEKREQQEVDEAIARMLEEEEQRGRKGSEEALVASMLAEEEARQRAQQQQRMAGGRPVAVH